MKELPPGTLIERFYFVNVKITAQQWPRTVKINFDDRGTERCFVFHDPRPIEEVMKFFSAENTEMLVIDLNESDHGYREYGRYYVVLRDDDGSEEGRWIADRVEIDPT